MNRANKMRRLASLERKLAWQQQMMEDQTAAYQARIAERQAEIELLRAELAADD